MVKEEEEEVEGEVVEAEEEDGVLGALQEDPSQGRHHTHQEEVGELCLGAPH